MVSPAQSYKKALLGSLILSLTLAIIFLVPSLPLASNKALQASFASPSHQAMYVFFGFKACGDVCPNTLAKLALYRQEESDPGDTLGIYFIDIDRQSNQASAIDYAKQFSTRFVGVHPSDVELATLSSNFNLNFAQQEDSIRHQGRLYFAVKQGNKWFLQKTYNPGQFDRQDYGKDTQKFTANEALQ